MKKNWLLIIMVIFGGFFLSVQVDSRASELAAPKQFLKRVYINESGSKIWCSVYARNTYQENPCYRVQMNLYRYGGKKIYSTILKRNNISHEAKKKIPKKDKRVYYCKVRVLYNNKPVSSWTKPIYLMSLWRKHIKVKVLRVKINMITFKVRLPKMKGMKNYRVIISNWTPDKEGIELKKTIKPGSWKTITLNKLVWGPDGKTKKALVDIYVWPSFKKKSDSLSGYKGYNDDILVDRSITIKLK